MEPNSRGPKRSEDRRASVAESTDSRAVDALPVKLFAKALVANLVGAADKAELDRLATVMTNPKLHFVAGEIDGYTDNVGDAAYNEKLSKARADAVAEYLKAKGVVLGDRFTTTGYGAADPVGDNSTEEGRAQNRRVTIRRTDCGPAS